MNISGIGAYTGNYNYNSISPIQQRLQTPVQPVDKVQKNPQGNVPSEQEIAEARKNQTFTSEKFAKQYVAGDKADMVGTKADITKLDETGKASDSAKSQLMKQYQSFVGDTQAQGDKAAAMNAQAVRATENFTF